MLTMHLGMVGGPSLAGVVTAAGGLKLCYLVDAVSFAGSLYAVFRLPPMPPAGIPARIGPAALVEGLGFIRRSRVVLGALLADLSATALAMPFALFPAINAERFGGSPTTLGLLTAAIAAGGIIGTALSGPVSHVTRPGRAMLACVVVWSVGLVGFGVVDGFVPTVAFLALAGTADVLSVVFRSTVLLTATPDGVRGRVSSAEFVVGGRRAAARQLPGGRAGLADHARHQRGDRRVSSLAGAAVIALALPALARYRLPVTPEPAPPPASDPSDGRPANAPARPT